MSFLELFGPIAGAIVPITQSLLRRVAENTPSSFKLSFSLGKVLSKENQGEFTLEIGF